MPRSHIVFRPLPAWTDPVTKHRTPHRFRVSFNESLTLLRDEVDRLNGQHAAAEIVLQVDVISGDLRQDGMLRANATVRSPGVVVSFGSQHGPLRYATDRFTSTWAGQMPGWQANVRAIALGLGDLRRLDQYGITSRGEQYAGWAQLGSGIAMPAAMTRAEAARFVWSLIGDHWAGPGQDADRMLTDPEFCRLVVRSAVKHLHPDVGGNTDQYQRVLDARTVLTNP